MESDQYDQRRQPRQQRQQRGQERCRRRAQEKHGRIATQDMQPTVPRCPDDPAADHVDQGQPRVYDDEGRQHEAIELEKIERRRMYGVKPPVSANDSRFGTECPTAPRGSSAQKKPAPQSGRASLGGICEHVEPQRPTNRRRISARPMSIIARGVMPNSPHAGAAPPPGGSPDPLMFELPCGGPSSSGKTVSSVEAE